MLTPFWSWLGERPLFLNLAGGVGAAICGAGIDQNWGTNAAWGWIAGVAASVALPALAARRNALNQGARAAADAIKRLLAACGSSFGHPGRHVRVNIMLPCLKTDTRREVHTLTAFNMDDDPDRDLAIDAGAGVSGEAFMQRRAAWADLTLAAAPGAPTWGLSKSEKAKVRPGLRSLLSVPVLNPANPLGLPPFATLQVDTDEEIAVSQFDKQDRQDLAQAFADVVALLIQGSDPR